MPKPKRKQSVHIARAKKGAWRSKPTTGSMCQGEITKDQVIHFIEHRRVHLMVVTLLIIDIFLVTVSIGLEIE